MIIVIDSVPTASVFSPRFRKLAQQSISTKRSEYAFNEFHWRAATLCRYKMMRHFRPSFSRVEINYFCDERYVFLTDGGPSSVHLHVFLSIGSSFRRDVAHRARRGLVRAFVSETLNRTHDGFSWGGGSVLMQRRTSINAAAHVNVPAHKALVM